MLLKVDILTFYLQLLSPHFLSCNQPWLLRIFILLEPWRQRLVFCLGPGVWDLVGTQPLFLVTCPLRVCFHLFF